jgi:hypothetical protein
MVPLLLLPFPPDLEVGEPGDQVFAGLADVKLIFLGLGDALVKPSECPRP